MAKQYLVTGCAGFIGSRVAEILMSAGHEVAGVDNVNDAYDPRLKRWRLERLAACPRFTFHAIDLSNRDQLRTLFGRVGANRAPFDAVINLAARAGVRPSVENPWIYFQTNCEGTLNLLECCRQHGVPKFVLASTSSLYGAHNSLPYAEDAHTDRPLSPYAASKKAAETIAYSYHYLHGIDVSVLRYFTVYGPAGRPDMSLFRFVRWISEEQPVTLFGDGSQRRDFTYVDDVARGTIAALRPMGYEIINLGGDRPVTISSVIEHIATLTGKSPRVEQRDPHRADMPASWANIGKAARLLDWAPATRIEEGLRRCVEWYTEHREFARQLELGPV
jgi:nucleoside-diphosphate-sugar epimerase